MRPLSPARWRREQQAWSPAEGPGGEAGFYTGDRATVGGDGTNQGAI